MPAPVRITSLDPHETTGRIRRVLSNTAPGRPAPYSLQPTLDESSLAEIFRHSGWRPTRRRVYRALIEADVPTKRLNRFCTCGANPFVVRSEADPDCYAIVGNFCNDRFCVPCGRERSRRITSAVISREQAEKLKFLTLTLCSPGGDLGGTVGRLWKSFSRLRRTALWKTNVKGGIAFLETKYRPASDDWHTHLHALIDSRYIPQADLSKMWQKCSGGSKIVDIRWPRSTENVAKYLTKYAGKPLDPTMLGDQQVLVRAVKGLTHRKLYVQFGDWKGKPLSEADQEHGWQIVCSLEELVLKAGKGDPDACRIAAGLGIENVAKLAGILPLEPRKPPRSPPREPSFDPLLFPIAHDCFS